MPRHTKTPLIASAPSRTRAHLTAPFPALALLLLAAAGACQAARPSPDEIHDPPAPAVAPSLDAIPVPGRHLDRTSGAHAGLLSGDVDGTPRLSGPGVDPRILEARRFYDTLQYPRAEAQAVDYPDPFTGEMKPMRKTAPLTLARWKEVFGFSPRAAGESLEAHRARTGIVIYYNKNELGLGRELGCAEFDDGHDASGAALKGVACFVSNFGVGFNDPHRGLALAADGSDPRNTVCITYRPSLGPGYEVQFYTFGGDGRRQDWAQLDTLGARPHPHVCMNCHGGAYDSSKHLARGARFLPLDPNLVTFGTGTGAAPTRGAQEEPIRAMNALALRTPLTGAQREMLHELYDGKVQTPGATSRSGWTPAGWKGSAREVELYDKVVKPFCATCHLAIEHDGNGRPLPWYSMFQSLDELRRFPMQVSVCGTFSMPNAQPTLAHFWDVKGGPLTIAGRTHAAPADAFLDIYGLDRRRCQGLSAISSCDRGEDPDALCGNAASGSACNLDSGQCLSPMSKLVEAPQATGVCRTDGSRRCPKASTCEAGPPLAGLPGFDGLCLPD